MNRTLRSKKLRVLLWHAADGKCQSCGGALGDDWQADHVVPWKVTHRTNVHEMQALCADCNRKKGARMTTTATTGPTVSQINLDGVFEAMRPGQEGALQTIMERAAKGEAYTSVILPTRYGKTDVARVAAAVLKQNGAIACTLLLVPGEYLRGQVTSDKKWNQSWKRYGITMPAKMRAIKGPEADFWKNDEVLLCATIQLAQRNIDLFVKWVETVRYRTGKTVMVVIDEAHTGSEANTWGDVASALAKAGARVVLMTATAFRSDGKPIAGFDWDVVSEKETRYTTVRAADDPQRIILEDWLGSKRMVRLKANWETSFQAAWSERPSPLCKLSRVPFDVDLLSVESELAVTRSGLLSEKTPAEARAILGRIVRDPRVIREGVSRLIEELRRLKHMDRTAAAIVFCGNDDDPEQKTNEHANAIAREIKRHMSEWQIVIATHNQGPDANDAVRTFANGTSGDVLVVKQMASVGLDVERLKVCLDLSATRTAAASIQRWTRVATPFGALTVGVLIAPDDVLGREQFRVLVTDEGGEMPVTGDAALLGQREVEKRPPPGEQRVTPLVNSTGDSEFEDSMQNHAQRDQQRTVAIILEKFPELGASFTHAEVAQRLGPVIVTIPDDGETGVEDLTAQIEDERSWLNAKVRDLVKVRMAGVPYSQAVYQQTSQGVWVELYQSAGVPIGVHLDKITDMRLIARMKAVIESMVSREVRDASYAFADR